MLNHNVLSVHDIFPSFDLMRFQQGKIATLRITYYIGIVPMAIKGADEQTLLFSNFHSISV